MLSALAPLLYVKVSPSRLTVRDVRKGTEISEVPEVAISQGDAPAILGVGQQARFAASGQPSQVVNPFEHPRTLIADWNVAEQLLKAFVRRLCPHSWLAFAPRILMHPLGSPVGGFTQIELRAFRELARGAGASDVVLWIGRELTDQEAQSPDVLRHPRSG